MAELWNHPVVELFDDVSWHQFVLSIASAVIFLIFRFIFLKVQLHGGRTQEEVYIWRKITNYATLFLIIIAIGIIWIDNVQTVLTVIGVLAAGFAVALRDVIANFVGWLFIVSRKTFTVGDRIQVGDHQGTHRGDVIDVGLFHFSLIEVGNWVDAEQSTGRILKIPNARILTETIANYTKDFEYIWNEVPVVITFESDWQQAKEILTDVGMQITTKAELKKAGKAFRDTAKKYYFRYSKLTPIVYTKVVDFGVQLTLRYLTKIRSERETEQFVWEELLKAFAQHPEIDFAYPTRRVVNLESAKLLAAQQDAERIEEGAHDGVLHHG